MKESDQGLVNFDQEWNKRRETFNARNPSNDVKYDGFKLLYKEGEINIASLKDKNSETIKQILDAVKNAQSHEILKLVNPFEVKDGVKNDVFAGEDVYTMLIKFDLANKERLLSAAYHVALLKDLSNIEAQVSQSTGESKTLQIQLETATKALKAAEETKQQTDKDTAENLKKLLVALNTIGFENQQ